MGEALRQCRIHSILAHIAPHPEIIRIRALILRQLTPLEFILMRSIPRPQNNLTTAAHSLRIRTHHADGAHILQHILRGNRLGANPRLRKRHVLGDILRQVMTHHQHVEVLVERVLGKRTRGIRRSR